MIIVIIISYYQDFYSAALSDGAAARLRDAAESAAEAPLMHMCVYIYIHIYIYI